VSNAYCSYIDRNIPSEIALLRILDQVGGGLDFASETAQQHSDEGRTPSPLPYIKSSFYNILKKGTPNVYNM